MKRAVIYCRVSSVEQASEEHVSLQVQEERCRAYAAREGYDVVASERDVESGLNINRPGYNRVLELARAGAVDAVIVLMASRFGRRAWELMRAREELLDAGVEIRATEEDLSSPLFVGLHAIMAEDESRRLAARVGPAKRLKASQGYWLGHSPFGTVNVKGILQPGPHFDLLQLAFQLAADGVPIRQIALRINAARAPATMTTSTLRKILYNPAYVGRVVWADVDAQALWEPLVDPDVFDRVQLAVRARYVRRAPLSQSFPFWVVGLAHCGRCGHRMHPKVSTKTWGTKYAYLVCGHTDDKLRRGCHPTHYAIDDVQAWVVDQLERTAIDQGAAEDLLEVVARRDRILQDQHDDRRRSLRAERDRLVARLQTAKAAHLDAPKTFKLADVVAIERSVADTLAAIDADLAQPALEPGLDLEDLRRFLVDRDWMALRDTNPAVFRSLLQPFIERVDVRGRGEYSIAWTRAAAFLAVPAAR